MSIWTTATVISAAAAPAERNPRAFTRLMFWFCAAVIALNWTEITAEFSRLTEPVCLEDMACWDCSTMGNKICWDELDRELRKGITQ